MFNRLPPLLLDGVYKAGFASSAEAYEAAVYPLFEALDKVEKILEGKEFFVGNQLTEADIRLWVTIVRFPAAFPLCPLFLVILGCLTISVAPVCRFASTQSMLGTSNATSAIFVMGTRISTGLFCVSCVSGGICAYVEYLTEIGEMQVDERFVLEKPRVQGFYEL